MELIVASHVVHPGVTDRGGTESAAAHHGAARGSGPARVDGPNGNNEHPFRPDIEGLRALAVVLVVLDHLVAWPRGGFIGVDVFFVISGYLITGLLLNETATNGHLSIVGFYKRRARRILPAALTVLAACFVASRLVFRGTRVQDTLTDICWALGFSANIHFARLGTDYFQANRPPSLVQHFWSLAVEEQFYLFWPIIMLLVLSVLGRMLKAQTALVPLLMLLAAGSAGSFVLAIHETATNSAAAYFSTPVRAWELGVGALLSVMIHRFPRIATPRHWPTAGPLVAVGLLGIVASALLITATSGFPAPVAALPVLATVLVILGGVAGPTGRWSAVLTNPISRYLGRVSFSLYLWHWPVILICQALVPDATVAYYVMTLSATAGLTVLSYHLVETPLRTPGGWRRPDQPPQRHRSRTPTSARSSRSSFTKAALVGWTLVTVCVGSYLFKPPPPVFAITATDTGSFPPPQTAAAQPDVAQPSRQLAGAIETAVQSEAWPNLDPPLDQLFLASAFKQWAGCRDVEQDVSGCRFGKARVGRTKPKVAVVLGDSIAMAWLPTVERALLPQGWVIYGLALELCPAADTSVDGISNKPATAAACDAHHSWVLTEVAKLKPDLVIMSSSEDTLSRLHNQSTRSAADAEYQAGMVKTERLIRAPGRQIVTLSPPPVGNKLSQCATATSVPADCVTKVTRTWQGQSTADAAAAKISGTKYFDTHLWFCTAFGDCPSFVGDTPVFWDGVHLTEPYADSLGPALARLLGPSTGT